MTVRLFQFSYGQVWAIRELTSWFVFLSTGPILAMETNASGALRAAASDALLAALCERRTYLEVTTDGPPGRLALDPRLLVFELSSQLMLRPVQIEIVGELMAAAGDLLSREGNREHRSDGITF